MISCTTGLLLSIGCILMDFKIEVSIAYLLVVIISLIFRRISTKLTCLSYVLPTVYIIDMLLVISGVKGEYFRLEYLKLIYLVGGLHLLEGILTYTQGGRHSQAIMTYRGREVAGGYQAQSRWFIPLLLFSIQDIYIPMMVILVYASDSFVFSPRGKARYMGVWIGIYGMGILLLAYLSATNQLPLLMAMLTMPLLHELLMATDYYVEQGEFIYTYPSQGIRVMELRHKSQEIEGGYIERGDIILKVNEVRINSEETYFRTLTNERMHLVVKKISGEIVDVYYNNQQLQEMGMVFLPPT